MASLKEKANNILTEKNNSLLPNNIKEGVQIFNITGTLKENIPAVTYKSYLTDVNMENITTTYIFEPNGKGGYVDTLFGHQVKDTVIGKLTFNVVNDGNIYIDVGPSENSDGLITGYYKWLLVGKLDTELSSENANDDSTLIQQSFQGEDVSVKRRVVFENVTAGTHFIYLKIVTNNKWHNLEQYLIEPVATETIYNNVLIYDTELKMKNDKTQPVNTLALFRYNKVDIDYGVSVVYKFDGTTWNELSGEDSIGFNRESVEHITYQEPENTLYIDYGQLSLPITVRSGARCFADVYGDRIADSVGLTPDVLAEGTTILGVTGTLSTSSATEGIVPDKFGNTWVTEIIPTEEYSETCHKLIFAKRVQPVYENNFGDVSKCTCSDVEFGIIESAQGSGIHSIICKLSGQFIVTAISSYNITLEQNLSIFECILHLFDDTGNEIFMPDGSELRAMFSIGLCYVYNDEGIYTFTSNTDINPMAVAKTELNIEELKNFLSSTTRVVLEIVTLS